MKQPKTFLVQDYKNAATGVINDSMRQKVIYVCTDFAKRLYGQDDLNKPTTKFDNCGFIMDG